MARTARDTELERMLLSGTDSRTLPDLPNKKNKTNWVEKAGGLPSYINRIAKHLHSEKGMDTSRAIATAVNTVKRWARGEGGVSDKTKALAAKAVAEWEAKKGASKVNASGDKERHLFYRRVWLSASDRDLIERLLSEDTNDMDLSTVGLRTEIHPGKYALALNAARRERGLSLSMPIRFEPNLHPRDLKGQFAKVVGGLKVGETAQLPDGGSVKRNTDHFVIKHPEPARLGGSRDGVTLHDKVKITKANTDKHAANQAAYAVLSHSAATKHPDSVGGTKVHDPIMPGSHKVITGANPGFTGGQRDAAHVERASKGVHPDMTPDEYRAARLELRKLDPASEREHAQKYERRLPKEGADSYPSVAEHGDITKRLEAAKGAGAATDAQANKDLKSEMDRQKAGGGPTVPAKPDRAAGDKGNAAIPSDVIDVGSDVNKAADLLAQGKHVRLDQPRSASVLLGELAKRVQEAKALGDKAPNFDLCKVTVKNSNLFCAESKGIPRVKMPQLSGVPTPGTKADALEKNAKGEVNLGDLFRAHLGEQGIKIEDTSEKASFLRASQIELNGGKVAGMTQALEAGKVLGGNPRLFVSHDNYIVDGHHRWAAHVGHDIADNKLGDINMEVARVDMGIIELLDASNRFAAEWGIPQAAVHAPSAAEGDPAKKTSGFTEPKHPKDSPPGRFGNVPPAAGGGGAGAKPPSSPQAPAGGGDGKHTADDVAKALAAADPYGDGNPEGFKHVVTPEVVSAANAGDEAKLAEALNKADKYTAYPGDPQMGGHSDMAKAILHGGEMTRGGHVQRGDNKGLGNVPPAAGGGGSGKPAAKSVKDLTPDEAAAELDHLGTEEMNRSLTAAEQKRMDDIDKQFPGLANEAAGSAPGTSGPVRDTPMTPGGADAQFQAAGYDSRDQAVAEAKDWFHNEMDAMGTHSPDDLAAYRKDAGSIAVDQLGVQGTGLAEPTPEGDGIKLIDGTVIRIKKNGDVVVEEPKNG